MKTNKTGNASRVHGNWQHSMWVLHQSVMLATAHCWFVHVVTIRLLAFMSAHIIFMKCRQTFRRCSTSANNTTFISWSLESVRSLFMGTFIDLTSITIKFETVLYFALYLLSLIKFILAKRGFGPWWQWNEYYIIN